MTLTTGKLCFLKISVRCISERFNLVLQNVKKDYEAKQSEGTSGKEMFGLALDVKELGDLNEVGRELTVECTTLIDKILDPSYDRIANNLANQISVFRERALSFVKRVTKYRRQPATHVLVVLISPEERNKKPYALAVQCIAYKSIKDAEVRQICNKVVKEMTARQIKVAGVCGTCMIDIDYTAISHLLFKQDLQATVSGIACAPRETPDLCQYLKFVLWQGESTVIYLPSK